MLARTFQLAAAPTAAAAVAACAFLTGVPGAAVARYALYLALVLVVPGVLLWRLLGVRAVSRAEELAAGSALGLAVHTGLAWALSAVGGSRWAAGWGIVVAGAAVAVGLRRRRRGAPRREPAPAWHPATSWAVALVVVAAVGWVAVTAFRTNPLALVPGTGDQFYAAAPYIDMPFHQALVGAVQGPWPLEYPYVTGVDLRYTTMVYVHQADAGAWAGVDRTLVVMRLGCLLPVALAVVLCAVLAQRLAGRQVAAPLGAVLGTLTAPAAVYGGMPKPFTEVATLNLGTFRSPTQTFGEPLFLLLLLLVVIALEPGARRGLLVPAAAVGFVAGGAKATFLPLLLCGLVAALALWPVTRSWPARRLLVLAGGTVAVWLAGLLLVVGTETRSLTLSVSGGSQLLRWMPVVGALGDPQDLRVQAAGLVLFLAASAAAGALGLVALVTRFRDVRFVVLAGALVAGFAAAMLGEHSGLSQLYFLRSAWPLVGVLAATGASDLLARTTWSVRTGAAVLTGALAAGVGAVALAREVHQGLGPATRPGLLAPWVALVACAALAATLALAGATAARRRSRPAAGPASRPALTAAVVGLGVLVGGSLTTQPAVVVHALRTPPTAEGLEIPGDGAAAARWLRDASDPADRVVTNVHCRVPDPASCDGRQFWVTALTEREVVLEGWEYSTPSGDVAPGFTGRGPYWDPAFLDRNDDAAEGEGEDPSGWFAGQSADWVLLDERLAPGAAPDGGREAFRSGDFVVYELSAAGA